MVSHHHMHGHIIALAVTRSMVAGVDRVSKVLYSHHHMLCHIMALTFTVSLAACWEAGCE
jgi:hypothetical protein